MSANYWIGGATPTVQQVDTLTVGGTVEADDVFSVTLTNEAGTATTMDVVAGSTTISTVCTNIANAFNARTDAPFTGITAAAGATTVTLTADTAGIPFHCTVATTENGGGAADAQTFARAATTANKGPNDWGTASNWYTGAVPVSTDDVVIDSRGAYDILYGLGQAAVTLATLAVERSFVNVIGTINYGLQIGATICYIGREATDGSNVAGSQLVSLNFGTIQTTVHFYGGNRTGTNGRPAVNLRGSHVSNAVHVYANDGNLGIAAHVPAETATVATLHLLEAARNIRVEVGSGTTLTTVNQDAGNLTVRCAATTINQDGGNLITEGSGAITTINVNGNATLNSSGTITTLNVADTGNADFTQSNASRTVSNANVYGGGKVNDDNSVVTWTNGVDVRQGARTTQVNLGSDITVTPSAL